MKKFCLHILICFSCLVNGLAQDCISDTLTLSSQQEIDDFPINYPTCTNVLGTIIISAPDLTNLNGLSQIISIEKELIFENNSFTDLSLVVLPSLSESGPSGNKVTFINNPSLFNLSGLGSYMNGKFDTIVIENNPALLDMSGFNSGGDIIPGSVLRISNNPQMASLAGMETLVISEGIIQLIGNPVLTSLNGLNNINVFEKLELIDNPQLSNLSGIAQVTTFGKGLTIKGCDALVNLQGLDNLITIGEEFLIIDDNNALTDLNGLQNLINVGGLSITNNPNLTTLIHLNDLTEVTEYLDITNNAALQNFDGLEGITSVQQFFQIRDLPLITDLQGLSNLEFVGNNFEINNIALTITDLSDLESLRFIGGNLEISRTGFVTLDGLDSIQTINGRLYLQQNDALIDMEGLSNLTTVGNLVALRFNDLLPSLEGLRNIDPNSMDSLNLVSNDLLEFCAQPNFCSFLANGGGHLIFDNLPSCNDVTSLVANCQIVDPKIVGKIYIDENMSCENENEVPLNDVILQFEDLNNVIYYATSNAAGYYEISLPPSDYTVSVINFSDDFWEFCENNVLVENLLDNQEREQNFGLTPKIECPKLTVDVSGGSLLPCVPTVFQVNYCNTGTLQASDIEIAISFDEGFTFIGSTATVTNVAGNTYFFSELDDLDINHCVSFEVTAVYDPNCNTFVTNQTACIIAEIKPDDFCLPPAPAWDESSISVNGFCDGDSVRYTITNTGSQNMTSASDYIIIEDVIMRVSGVTDTLEVNESIELSFPASGKTIRLEVLQTSDHPGFSKPSFTVEGCDPDGDNMYSLGFYRQYAQDDIDAFIDIECMDVLETAYANEKTADPIGVSEAHCLQNDIPIEYTFHFQNTGMTTVEQVTIFDTLSPLLDIKSIQPGSSSHAYDFEVIDNGTVKFTFPKINLVSAEEDELESRGFVGFKIGQKEDNPFGSVITNQASIYLDTTFTTMTDMVFHTVSPNYCIDTMLVSVHPVINNSNTLAVYPNPFSTYTIFEWIDKATSPNGVVLIYDVTGRLMDSIVINKQQTIVERNSFSAGVYFYELKGHDGVRMAQGKLVIF